jgi:hypothetical protein
MNDAERLEKLLLMLSSDQPGEVVNAARAIGRTLRDNGSDWHDLARRLLVPARESARKTSDYSTGNSSKDWRALRGYCLQHEYMLRPREHEFVNGLGAWRGDLTEKQSAWLIAIHQRLRRANR